MSGPHGPTVTGTANVLSAAVLARGVTTITGAAVEPEIVDLGNFLNSMGARIAGLGTPTIRVTGVDVTGVGGLSGTTYRVIPDRIEAATLLLAAAITRGSVTATGVVPEHLGEVLAALRAAGFRVDVQRTAVTLTADGPPRPIDITARPYPGVPSDVQAQWMALLALATGRGTVRDCVFPGRFMHVAELNRLGARIECREGSAGVSAIVTGVDRLSGAEVTATDLRASAALVLAGLAARGQTIVRHIHHLDRGYERLDRKLNRLGARVHRPMPKGVAMSIL
jgi:UDP-N-acetylglucosamine 1-carboxyvinyltransferase